MSKLVSSVTMTVDGVVDVSGWFVAEGAHDLAQAVPDAALLHPGHVFARSHVSAFGSSEKIRAGIPGRATLR